MTMPAAAQGADEPGSARTEGEAQPAEESPEEAPPEAPSPYRNPTGTILIAPSFGISSGDAGTAVGVGVGVGYAVYTGVLPALRGLIIFADRVAGELALDLTLTPPLDFYLVPFIVGEVGRRFDAIGGAWIYGGGGGLYLGEPRSALGLQVGWVFRRYVYDAGEVDGSGLLLALSIRL